MNREPVFRNKGYVRKGPTLRQVVMWIVMLSMLATMSLAGVAPAAATAASGLPSLGGMGPSTGGSSGTSSGGGFHAYSGGAPGSTPSGGASGGGSNNGSLPALKSVKPLSFSPVAFRFANLSAPTAVAGQPYVVTGQVQAYTPGGWVGVPCDVGVTYTVSPNSIGSSSAGGTAGTASTIGTDIKGDFTAGFNAPQRASSNGVVDTGAATLTVTAYWILGIPLCSATVNPAVLSGPADGMTLSANPATVPVGGSTAVSGSVYDQYCNVVAPTDVALSFTGAKGGTFSPASLVVTADNNGTYSATFTPNPVLHDSLGNLTASVSPTVSQSVPLTVEGAGYHAALNPSSYTVDVAGGTVDVTGTILDPYGNPGNGTVILSSPAYGSFGSVSYGSGGAFSVTYTLPANPQNLPSVPYTQPFTVSVAGSRAAPAQGQIDIVANQPDKITVVFDNTTGVTAGASDTISGVVTDQGWSVYNCTVNLTSNGWTGTKTTTTGPDNGDFSLNVSAPQQLPTIPFTWTVTAAAGAVTSLPASINVNPGPPMGISLVGPNYPVPAGSNVTVHGYVYDQYGNGIDGQTVTFAFQPSQGLSAGPVTTVDDSSNGHGYYTATFTAPSTAGPVTVTASVSGTTPVVQNTATVTVSSGSYGGGGAGVIPPSAPSTATVIPAAPAMSSNLPSGALLDRQTGSVFAGDGTQTAETPDGSVYQAKASATVAITINTQAPGPDYTIEIYHWQSLPLPGTDLPGRWIALATTMQKGQAVAVNDGNYTGWFAAWWVIKPHFTDIAGSWAENDIRRMDGLGMVEGYPGNGLNRPFEPDRPITRIELTVIAARIMGLNPGTHAYAYLQPVSAAQADAILQKAYSDWQTIPGWARSYVAAMTQAGYVQGMDGKFNGGIAMPRTQAGVLVSNILRAIGYKTPADVSQFTDAGSIPAWAKGQLVSGVLDGSNGLLRPTDTITRAEETVVLLRLFRTLGW